MHNLVPNSSGISAWTNEQILHVIAWEFMNYGPETRSALEREANVRGLGGAEIESYREKTVDYDPEYFTCSACNTELLLEPPDLRRGHFRCPACDKIVNLCPRSECPKPMKSKERESATAQMNPSGLVVPDFVQKLFLFAAGFALIKLVGLSFIFALISSLFSLLVYLRSKDNRFYSTDARTIPIRSWLSAALCALIILTLARVYFLVTSYLPLAGQWTELKSIADNLSIAVLVVEFFVAAIVIVAGILAVLLVFMRKGISRWLAFGSVAIWPIFQVVELIVVLLLPEETFIRESFDGAIKYQIAGSFTVSVPLATYFFVSKRLKATLSQEAETDIELEAAIVRPAVSHDTTLYEQPSSLIHCKKCGLGNRQDSFYCIKCGTKIDDVICGRCMGIVRRGSACPKCGEVAV